MKSPTILEIASSYKLWQEYMDPWALVDEDEFDAMSIEERLAEIALSFEEALDAIKAITGGGT